MLVKVTNINPGDDIATARGGGIVESVEILDDGGTILVYTGGHREWLESGQMVVKKDKFQTFFAQNGVQ